MSAVIKAIAANAAILTVSILWWRWTGANMVEICLSACIVELLLRFSYVNAITSIGDTAVFCNMIYFSDLLVLTGSALAIAQVGRLTPTSIILTVLFAAPMFIFSAHELSNLGLWETD